MRLLVTGALVLSNMFLHGVWLRLIGDMLYLILVVSPRA